jgi:hypothetical protein
MKKFLLLLGILLLTALLFLGRAIVGFGWLPESSSYSVPESGSRILEPDKCFNHTWRIPKKLSW